MHCEFTYTTNAFQDESWDLSNSKGYEYSFIERDVKLTQETFTNDKPYIVNTEKRLSRIANNKAVGIDQVPGEWIKIKWFNKKEQEMNEL